MLPAVPDDKARCEARCRFLKREREREKHVEDSNGSRTAINSSTAGARRVFLEGVDNAWDAVLIGRGEPEVVVGRQVQASSGL